MHDLLKSEVLPFAVWVIVPIAIVVACLLHNIAKVNSNNDLKRRLAERGFSVDEIERIMDAGLDKEGD